MLRDDECESNDSLEVVSAAYAPNVNQPKGIARIYLSGSSLIEAFQVHTAWYYSNGSSFSMNSRKVFDDCLGFMRQRDNGVSARVEEAFQSFRHLVLTRTLMPYACVDLFVRIESFIVINQFGTQD